MESDDKPFECTVPGCSQRFANNDHLAVHKQKHQLKLQLGPHKAGELSAVDQTPTPTRFLKNCDEAGLFDEIHIHANPFDQDFRRAVSEDLKASENTTTPAPVTTTVLTHTSQANGDSDAVVVVESSSTSQADHPDSGASVVSIRSLSTSRAENKVNISVPASVLVHAPHAHSVLPTVIPVSIANPNAPVQAALPVPGHLKRSTSSMPISIPTPAIVTSPSAANPPSFIGSAKQRLKEQLRQQHVNNHFGGGNNNIISRAMTEAVDMVTSQHNGISSHQPVNPVLLQAPHKDELESQQDNKRGGKRPRRTQEDLDPDERRKRFLERNRAAATRCREKRKIWVTQLEKKAEDLTVTNTQLQNEISLLRTEVAQLKSLLLAHKDCPVTLAQQKMGTTQLLNQGVSHSNGHSENSEDIVTSALTHMANRGPLELEIVTSV